MFCLFQISNWPVVARENSFSDKSTPTSPWEVDYKVEGGIEDETEMVEAGHAEDPRGRDIVKIAPADKYGDFSVV